MFIDYSHDEILRGYLKKNSTEPLNVTFQFERYSTIRKIINRESSKEYFPVDNLRRK